MATGWAVYISEVYVLVDEGARSLARINRPRKAKRSTDIRQGFKPKSPCTGRVAAGASHRSTVSRAVRPETFRDRSRSGK